MSYINGNGTCHICDVGWLAGYATYPMCREYFIFHLKDSHRINCCPGGMHIVSCKVNA